MAITFTAGTITVANGTFTWQDVKDADDTNAWGQIAELGAFMSQCIAVIQVGDDVNATTLVVEDEIIDFQGQWTVERFATVRFGQKADGRPSHGCHLIFDTGLEQAVQATDSGQVDETELQILVYDVAVTAENTGQRENWGGNINDPYYTDFDRQTYERTVYDSTQGITYVGTNSFANDFVMIGNRYGMEFEGSGITLSNIKPHHVQESALRIFSLGVTVRNFRGAFNNFDVKATNGHTSFVIDSLFDETKLFHDGGAGTTTNNQKSINWIFNDPAGNPLNGSRAVLWDNVNSVVFDDTSDAQGILAEKIVTIATYTGTNTPPTPPSTTGFNPHFFRQYKYGQKQRGSSLTITSKISGTIVLSDDPVIALSEAAASVLTGIAIDYGLETVTISEDHTLSEIYDYMSYDITQNPQRNLDTAITSSDGETFDLSFDFIVNTGVTVTADNQTLNITNAKTWTLNGSAAFTGILDDGTTAHVHVVINVRDVANQPIAGARVYLEDSLSAELINQLTDASGTITVPFDHTSDESVSGSIRKGSASPLYKPVDISGTITNTGFQRTVLMQRDE